MAELPLVFEGPHVPPPQSEGSRASWVPSSADWETYKDIILEMCKKETLAKVAKEMQKLYGFTATIDMYRSRIYKVWKVRQKYNKEDEMRALAVIAVARERQNKSTVVDLHGRLLDTREIRRHFWRKKKTIEEIAASSEQVTYPEGLRILSPEPIYTPVSAPEAYSHVEKMMWHAAKFANHEMSDLLQEPKFCKSPSEAGNPDDTFRKLLNKAVSLADEGSKPWLSLFFARILTPRLWDCKSLECTVLEAVVLSLELAIRVNDTLELQLVQGVAYFLIKESSNINPSIVEILRGLPGCHLTDMIKVLHVIDTTLYQNFKRSFSASEDPLSYYKHDVLKHRSILSWIRRSVSTDFLMDDSCPRYLLVDMLERGCYSVKQSTLTTYVATALLKPESPMDLSFPQFLRTLDALAFIQRSKYDTRLGKIVHCLTDLFLFAAYELRFGIDDLQTIECRSRLTLSSADVYLGFKLSKQPNEITYDFFYSGFRELWQAVFAKQELQEFLQGISSQCMDFIGIFDIDVEYEI